MLPSQTRVAVLADAFRLPPSRGRRALAALFSVGEVALLRAAAPSSRLQVLCQALTVDKLAADSRVSQAGTAAPVPGVVQAYAWVTMGKLGLASESLAKRLVPLLVQELQLSKSPAVRNNIMVSLADLCVQYTALVDAHMGRLVACVHDDCELVRKQALAMLVRLLAADYVKCRGALFHQLLLALVDPSAGVRSVAEYVLRDTLQARMPLLAYNHFMEAAFILNRCQPVTGLGWASGEAAEASTDAMASQGTSLSQFESSGGRYPVAGPSAEAREARRRIYQALLGYMGPEHKAATAAKLCSMVLAPVAEGGLRIEGNNEELFLDALWVLASGHCRVGPGGKGGAAGAEADDEAAAAAEQNPAQAVTERARGALVASLMRKQMADGIVPVFLTLRSRLVEQRHPRLREVMETLALICRDYK